MGREAIKKGKDLILSNSAGTSKSEDRKQAPLLCMCSRLVHRKKFALKGRQDTDKGGVLLKGQRIPNSTGQSQIRRYKKGVAVVVHMS